MSLFSITYIIDQYVLELLQFETRRREKASKPMRLSHLRSVWAIRWTRSVARWDLRCGLCEVKRNELGLVGTAENRAGKIAPQENARSAKSESRRQRDR